MIDLAKEKVVSFSDAGKVLPPSRLGRPVSPSCLMRWGLHGVKTSTGRVYLEVLKVGGRWVTSIEALQRFAEAQTPIFPDAKEAPVARSRSQRQRGHDAANDRLKIAGW